MTLDELLEKVPAELRPVAAKYGAALVRMTAEEFCAWLELLIMGRDRQAWDALLQKLGDSELLAAWQQVGAKWDEANTRNAERLRIQREAAMVVLKVLLVASLAAVGL